MARVRFEQVWKRFDRDTIGLQALDLEIDDGELMVLVGPSGCGKSTALRIIAGLETISDGAIWIGDREVSGVDPERRNIAMVFQNYALYPHMSVYRNMAFGLRVRRMARREIDERVREAATMLGLTDTLKRKPAALSGGQRQRVAMGRAIVRDPSVFLMDEPLSNLDAQLRVRMRAEVTQLQRRLGTTMLYVTHDQVEAMTMGNRVAVLRNGVLQQVATPEVLYRKPANLFVGQFIGSPSMNILGAVLQEEAGELRLLFGEDKVRLPSSKVAANPRIRLYAERRVAVGIRPEHVDGLPRSGSRGDGSALTGIVKLIETLGDKRLVYLDLSNAPIVEQTADEGEPAQQEGSVASAVSSEFVGEFDLKRRIEIGQRIKFGVKVEELLLFDPTDGVLIEGS